MEINKIERELSTSGTTLVPLSIYFSDGYAKVEIALATGKREYDKRQTIAERERAARPSGRWRPGSGASDVRPLMPGGTAADAGLRAGGAPGRPGLRPGRGPRGDAAADQIDSFDIAYTAEPSGVVKVAGDDRVAVRDNSGRHGIDRYFVVREPYDDTQDAVYTSTNIARQQPGSWGGHPVRLLLDRGEAGRPGEQLRIRIGDPDETVSAATATYVISYDVTGAMRTFPIRLRRVLLGRHRARLDGRRSRRCPSPSGCRWCPGHHLHATARCRDPMPRAKVSDGVATFKQLITAAQQGVSIGVKIESGLLGDNKPHLEPDGSKLTSGEKAGLVAAAGGGGAILVGSPLVGMLWWRKNGRDQRYAGLAPGTIPLAGQTANVVANDPDIADPGRVHPAADPGGRGRAADRRPGRHPETAATIIDLAVRGALTVQSYWQRRFQRHPGRPERAAAPHDGAVDQPVRRAAARGGRGPVGPGQHAPAHQAMQQAGPRPGHRARLVPQGAVRHGDQQLGFGAIAVVVFGAFGLGAWVLLAAGPAAADHDHRRWSSG